MAGELTGVLLVGGASSRFGSPKALAELNGETLAARAWRVLGEGCEERIAVGKAADELGLPFPVLDDGWGVRAPLAGVVAGLRAAGSQTCVFLPVDAPFVPGTLIGALGRACRDAAVTTHGPLPAAVAGGRCRCSSGGWRRTSSGSATPSPSSTRQSWRRMPIYWRT